MTRTIGLFVAAGTLLALAAPALADDWVAAKLHGGVFTFIDNHWVQLQRGDIVPDGQVVRTLERARVVFVRGKEQVELAGNTQVMINDRDDQQFTTVKEWYGKVTVDAEVRNVHHFAVRTPDLAAVVKGTHFSVSADDDASSVEVQRGHVEVDDARSDDTVTVNAGESVTVGADAPMEVKGNGGSGGNGGAQTGFGNSNDENSNGSTDPAGSDSNTATQVVQTDGSGSSVFPPGDDDDDHSGPGHDGHGHDHDHHWWW